MLLQLLATSADAIGILGVIILLIAYYLLSVGKLSAHTLLYQNMNFFGAGFILISLMFHWNLASALIESAWMVISLIGMYKILYDKG